MTSGLLTGAVLVIGCLVVIMVAMAIYMRSSRRNRRHGYQTVHQDEDENED